jgi:hypothetical protein
MAINRTITAGMIMNGFVKKPANKNVRKATEPVNIA